MGFIDAQQKQGIFSRRLHFRFQEEQESIQREAVQRNEKSDIIKIERKAPVSEIQC